MESRTLALLTALTCLIVGAGVIAFSQDASADVMPQIGPPAIDDGGDPATVPAVLQPSVGTGPAASTLQGTDTVGTVEPTFRKREQTAGWTSGVIRGDIQLAVSALAKLGSMTIIVEEARRAVRGKERARRIMQKITRGAGTPTFEVRDVPFSEYPYIVSVHAPGLNGGQRTVIINEDNPLVEDVVLTITPGAPYSILLRDQDNNPHPEITVNMLPVGQPHGRTRHQGVTDNFGSVVFDDVLAGAYELSSTQQGQPFGKVEQITVQPGRRQFRGKVQGQGHTLTIPRGVRYELLVHDTAGYGVPGAKIVAVKTDRRTPFELEILTDGVGRAIFPHLLPGSWQFTVTCENCQRVDLQVTLKDSEPNPPRRDVKLVRSRW